MTVGIMGLLISGEKCHAWIEYITRGQPEPNLPCFTILANYMFTAVICARAKSPLVILSLVSTCKLWVAARD